MVGIEPGGPHGCRLGSWPQEWIGGPYPSPEVKSRVTPAGPTNVGVTTGCLRSRPNGPGGLALPNDLSLSPAGPRLAAGPAGPAAGAAWSADTTSCAGWLCCLGIRYCRLKPVIRSGYAIPGRGATGTVSVCDRPSAGSAPAWT